MVLFHLATFCCENTSFTWKHFVDPLKEYFAESNMEWVDGFTENDIKSKHSIYKSSFINNQTLPITNLVAPTDPSTVDENSMYIIAYIQRDIKYLH